MGGRDQQEVDARFVACSGSSVTPLTERRPRADPAANLDASLRVVERLDGPATARTRKLEGDERPGGMRGSNAAGDVEASAPEEGTEGSQAPPEPDTASPVLWAQTPRKHRKRHPKLLERPT